MEKGVTLWLRGEKENEWYRALVVKIGAREMEKCEVGVRITEGIHSKTERTLDVDIRAIENEKSHDVLLANSNDMVSNHFYLTEFLSLKNCE
jgi:hypothetical protein